MQQREAVAELEVARGAADEQRVLWIDLRHRDGHRLALAADCPLEGSRSPTLPDAGTVQQLALARTYHLAAHVLARDGHRELEGLRLHLALHDDRHLLVLLRPVAAPLELRGRQEGSIDGEGSTAKREKGW